MVATLLFNTAGGPRRLAASTYNPPSASLRGLQVHSKEECGNGLIITHSPARAGSKSVAWADFKVMFKGAETNQRLVVSSFSACCHTLADLKQDPLARIIRLYLFLDGQNTQ
ncbi:gastricsin-like [Platysternon megacephalum]|uniref:Gastricsin-like n=1 Tax=Platysternon megacephalum TaxID=55544 RepID=A0A4D9E913_9SAUR|nr:gastricsin-like [Platysternon megacephalum]